MQNGKGDKERPLLISRDELHKRWEETFGRKAHKENFGARGSANSVTVNISHLSLQADAVLREDALDKNDDDITAEAFHRG